MEELYLAQPADPYEWMSHWFHTNFPPSRGVNEDWPEPALGPLDIIEEAVGRGLHSFTSQLNLSRFGHTYPCPPVQ
jgi:hypothetical protein